MSRPKILNFAPREEPEDIRRAIEDAGYEIVRRRARLAGAAQRPRGRARRRGARCGGADGHVDPLHPDQPARDGGIAAPAHRRQVHGRRRRHRRRGGDRARHPGLPCADRGELLRRRRDHDGGDADAAQEGARARRRGARRPVARAAPLGTTYPRRRGPTAIPASRSAWSGLGRIGTRVAQLLAPWRVRIIAYDPYIEPARFLLAGVEAVDYETLLREVRRGVVPRRAHEGDAQHVLRRASSR